MTLPANTTGATATSADGVTLETLAPNVIGSPGGAGGFVPTGAMIPFAGATVPTGWLLCDGSAIPAAHTALIALVGANTPDLRGEFLRGLDGGRGVDPDSGRALLSSQDHAYQSHVHDFSGGADPVGSGTVAPAAQAQNNTTFAAATIMTGGTGNTSSETRPRNVAVNFIIKT